MNDFYFVPDYDSITTTTTTTTTTTSDHKLATHNEESGLLELFWNEGLVFRKRSDEILEALPSLPLPEYRDGEFDVGPSSWLLDPLSMGSSCDRQGRDTWVQFLDAGKVFDAGSVSGSSPDGKRKVVRDPESVGEQDVDVECGRKGKDPCHSGPKRARTAEVHNLSERRRRDRINEKMKALQELVPRCNKSDKASMLDDAIEYMKSLQLQVQMLSSVQYNIGQLGFADPQRYMQTIGLMGMNLGLGMGMAPGMDVGVRGMQRYAVPVGQFLPYNPFLGPHPANLRPPPVPSFQPTNVAITDSAPNSVDTCGSNMMQIPTFGNLYCQYPGLHHAQASTQVQNMVEPSSSKGIDTFSQIGKL